METAEHTNSTIYEFLGIDASCKVVIEQDDAIEIGTLTPGKYHIIRYSGACVGLLNCSTLFPLASLIYLIKGSYSAFSFLQNCHITPHQLRSDINGYFGFWTDACFPPAVADPAMIPFDSDLGQQLTRIAQGNSV
jgi:hypothetical protein